MDIQPRKTVDRSFEDESWVLTREGENAILTGTIDPEDFGLSEGDVLPGSTPVRFDAESRRYVPVFTESPGEGGDPSTFEQEAARGHVFKSVSIGAGKRVGIAVLWHGAVAAEKVVVPAGASFDVSLGSPHVLYV